MCVCTSELLYSDAQLGILSPTKSYVNFSFGAGQDYLSLYAGARYAASMCAPSAFSTGTSD